MKRTTLTTATLLTAAIGLTLAPIMAKAADPSPNPDHAQAEDQAQAQPPAMNETTFLGVDTVPMQPDARQELDLAPGTALAIRHVGPGTPADEAGLIPGDVLVKLNNQLIINGQQLAVLVRTFKPGDDVTLHIRRDGEPIELKATLAGRVLTPQRRINRIPLQPMPNLGDIDALFEQLRRPGFDPIAPGGNIHDMFDQMQRRMFEQRDEMQRMMDQMRDRLGEQNFHSAVSINDGKHILQLKSNGQDKHLNIQTVDGDVLFDGNVPEDGQIQGLPDDVQKKVDDLLKNNRIEFHMPQPRPNKQEPLPIA